MATQLTKDIKRCLTDWHKVSPATSPIGYLYIYRHAQALNHLNVRRATNHVLLNGIQQLKENYVDEAQVLERRYLDSLSVNDLANEMNIADSTLYVIQRTAIEHLAEIIEELENEFSRNQKSNLSSRLEASSYVNLVGGTDKIQQIIQLVERAEPPWILSLEGIGGLGKTSLADAVMRRLIEEGAYDEIGWVSARQAFLDMAGGLEGTSQASYTALTIIQQLFSQLVPELANSITDQERMVSILRERLKDLPHCIVVDNLETVRDVESLLPTLHDLTNPSKFILTSRYNQYAAPNIYHFPVPELDKPQTLELARQEAELSNLPLLASAPDQELDVIYETVGGNPLAIRLIIGQAQVFSLRSTLDRLKDAKGEPAENLYTYIFRQAWDSLDEAGRNTLLAMPLIQSNGEPLDYISQATQIDEDQLHVTLNQLVVRNLVNATGGLNQRRYSIHSLTRSFLHQQILQWQ